MLTSVLSLPDPLHLPVGLITLERVQRGSVPGLTPGHPGASQSEPGRHQILPVGVPRLPLHGQEQTDREAPPG